LTGLFDKNVQRRIELLYIEKGVFGTILVQHFDRFTEHILPCFTITRNNHGNADIAVGQKLTQFFAGNMGVFL